MNDNNNNYPEDVDFEISEEPTAYSVIRDERGITYYAVSSENIDAKARSSSSPSPKLFENAESGSDSDYSEDVGPIVKKMKSEPEKGPGSGAKSEKKVLPESKKNSRVLNYNETELSCPQCTFRTRSAKSWSLHLYRQHSTTLTQAGLVLRCACGHESYSPSHSMTCKISKITIVREEDGATVEPQAPSDDELKCPECDYQTTSVGAWVYHLGSKHFTTPIEAGLALRCACGNESYGPTHSRKCNVSKFTIVRKGASMTKVDSKITIVKKGESTSEEQISKLNDTELDCPKCDYRTRSVSGWYYHLRKWHSTTPILAGLALLCECGNVSYGDSHSRICEISKFTIVRKRGGRIRRMAEDEATNRRDALKRKRVEKEFEEENGDVDVEG